VNDLKRAILRSTRPTGFSFIELLVVIAMGVILLAIFVPYTFRVRENASRVGCSDQLRQIGVALRDYARANNGFFPRATYNQIDRPTGWTAFESRSSTVNDVTAALWLLVKQQKLATSLFVCPSTSDRAQITTDAPNFASSAELSYSYANPYSNAVEYGLTEYLRADFALVADRNPGISEQSDVTAVPTDAPPLEFAQANSRNHNRAGQNVLFAAGYVQFTVTPYCGVEGDNIFTAIAPNPIFTGIKPNHRTPGVFGKQYSPAWSTDSYLVPADSDE